MLTALCAIKQMLQTVLCILISIYSEGMYVAGVHVYECNI